MIPTLYESGSINGKTLGYGKIVDAIRCEISESINGEYSLELDYPVYGPMYNDLLGAKSIIAAGPNNDVEAFDIFKSSVPIDGVVTFYANHVSRRAAFQILTEDFVSGMSLHLVPQTVNGVRVGMTDSTGTTHRVNVAEPRPWLSAIVGDTDSLAAQGLEIEFITNFSPIDGTISVSGIAHNQRGSDNKAFVRFGANMVNIDYVTDETETYNAFLPYWTDGNGNVIKPTGNALAQPTTPITPIKAVPLDVTSAFQTQPTDSEMLTYATALLDSTKPWLPAKTVTVDMINGPEIDTHAVPVSMGDTVHVYWTDANINEELRVVAYKYDVLGETYTEIKLGTPETEFVATTGEAVGGGGGGSSLPTPQYVERTVTNVSCDVNGGYANVGDVYDDYGVPDGATITSFYIKGWSGANGAPSLVMGSNGRTLYCMMSDCPATVSSMTIRVFYA